MSELIECTQCLSSKTKQQFKKSTLNKNQGLCISCNRKNINDENLKRDMLSKRKQILNNKKLSHKYHGKIDMVKNDFTNVYNASEIKKIEEEAELNAMRIF